MINDMRRGGAPSKNVVHDPGVWGVVLYGGAPILVLFISIVQNQNPRRWTHHLKNQTSSASLGPHKYRAPQTNPQVWIRIEFD